MLLGRRSLLQVYKIISIEMAFLYYSGLTDIYTPAAAVVPNESQMALNASHKSFRSIDLNRPS